MSCGRHWKSFVVLLAPLLYLPLPLLIDTSAARCGYVIMIMATYWMTEAIHIYVTALIPIFAFPLLGVLSTKDVCAVYMKDTNMLYFGGLAIAVAVEHCRMHERIALNILIKIGSTPERLLLGFMIAMVFLSMWISNTAATAMMVPIVDVVLKTLYPEDSSNEPAHDKKDNKGEENIAIDNGYEMQIVTTRVSSAENTSLKTKSDLRSENQNKFVQDIIYLGVAYASNIGGTGSLTGTNPNLILLGFLNIWYAQNTGINYASWIIYSFPGMFIACILSYIYLRSLIVLNRYRYRKKKSKTKQSRPNSSPAVKDVLLKRLSDLGKFSFHEMTITILFVFLVLLWMLRQPQFIDGWGTIISEKFNIQIGGATPALFVVVLLFIFPSKPFWSKSIKESSNPSEGCLTWDVLHHRLQWGVLILMGGGFAIAEAGKKSGLSEWMGSLFVVFSNFPKEWTLVIICVVTAALTEIMSNTAVSSIIIPILNDMSLSLKVNPLYFLLPVTFCSSYAFMLPVATPPNAIVFDAAKNMPITRMMLVGLLMNLVCISVAILMINTYGVYMFDINTFPQWANTTVSAY